MENPTTIEAIEKQIPKKKLTTRNAILVLLSVAVIILIFNQFQLSSIGDEYKGFAQQTPASFKLKLPSGTPPVYGAELQVSYDDISPDNPSKADSTIQKLAQFEDTKLDQNLLQRYISIGKSISCEYCCGVPAIIFDNGERACGCAHSYAMRGLAKYLLTKHPEMPDEQILEELGKWKTLFFPDTMAKKALALKQKNIELNYINLASNKYRGIEKQAQGNGQMVGEC